MVMMILGLILGSLGVLLGRYVFSLGSILFGLGAMCLVMGLSPADPTVAAAGVIFPAMYVITLIAPPH